MKEGKKEIKKDKEEKEEEKQENNVVRVFINHRTKVRISSVRQ